MPQNDNDIQKGADQLAELMRNSRGARPTEAPEPEGDDNEEDEWLEDADGDYREAQAAEGEDEDHEQPEPAREEEFYEVKADGEVHKVSLKELTRAYQLSKGQQRKFDEIAETRRELDRQREQWQREAEQQKAALAQARQQQQAVIQQWLATQKPVTPPTPEEYDTDPIGSGRRMAEFYAHQQKLAQARAQLDHITRTRQAEEQQRTHAQTQAEVQRFLKARPDYDRQADGRRIVDYLASQGHTEAEIKAIVNRANSAPILVALLDQARAHDAKAKTRTRKGPAPEASEDSEAQERPAPRTMAPGTRSKTQKTSKAREQERNLDRLKKTGNEDAAVAVLLDRMNQRKQAYGKSRR